MISPVVVGIDELEQSHEALELAAREAGLRSAPLWIAHVYHRLPPAAVATPGGEVPEQTVLDAAVEPLAGALKQVRAAYPGMQIRTYASNGPPAPKLASLARDATLLVLGNRGRGGFAGMLLGSVALRTVTRASCPVAIARGTPREVNRVLVGIDVDDDTGGRVPLGFAFDEAAMRAADLVVLHAWADQGAFYPDPYGDYTRDHLAALVRDRSGRVDTVLEPLRREHPDVAVEVVVEGGSAARSLVEASGHADLLIIGARRHRDGKGVRLGAPTFAILHHAQCPVLIVPER